ncbi:hypothetical protein FRB95_013500 [Tulasnella sp. JGI-2019a]|nr:hypothetical protein FRB95_013500 [Tulasnella sp. JGI-2019a]
MDPSVRGLPLLSGPTPKREDLNSTTCRRCGKEFGFSLPIIVRTPKECNFCGYSYCSSCCDHQALMPRSGEETGYDPVDVCAFCIEQLIVTAAPRNQLREMPIAKLRAYLKAFSIQAPGALEKDDIVQAILDVRQQNGCLPAANEQYYRRNSVPDQRTGRPPKRSFLNRAADAATAARQAFDNAASGGSGSGESSSSRPPPQPGRPSSQPPPQNRPNPHQYFNPQQNQTPRRPHPPAQQSQPQPQPQPQQQQRRQQPQAQPQQPQWRPPAGPPPSQPQSRPQSSPSRPTTTPVPPRRTEEPIPSLSQLLNTSPEDLSRLSAHVLKEILHQNHVNARLILEKSDLVDRVRNLIEAERAERLREEELRRLEEEDAIERQREMLEEFRRREHERQERAAPPVSPSVAATIPLPGGGAGTPSSDDMEGVESTAAAPRASPTPAPVPPLSASPSVPPTMPRPLVERSGLCIVCQDAEANMALVDCG